MNINVWIITKICKALNQSFGETCCCFVLAFYNNPTSTLPFSHKPGEEGGLFCQQFLLYKQVLQSSSKCFFSLTGASTSLGLPITRSSPACLVSAPSLQKTKEKLAFRSTLTPDLPPTFALLPWSLSGAGPKGRPGAAACGSGARAGRLWLPSAAPGGDVEAGDHHEVRLAEIDAALQALRHALQRFQVLQGIQLQNLLQVNCKGEARWGRAACREG